MSTTEQSRFVSVNEYLLAEENSVNRNEYANGWVRAMAGGSNRHNSVVINVLGLLWADHSCDVLYRLQKFTLEST